MQNYFYNLHDQLVKLEIFKKDGTKEAWAYRYDALGRRISKARLKANANEVSDRHSADHTCLNTPNSKDILDSEIACIYTDADSYEPLAQIRNCTDTEDSNKQQTDYFLCDQIGILREMTDKDGNLLWFGDYYGWGKLKSETNIIETAHQPFRLQNRYCDQETGIHYNLFRHYESDTGRFINQYMLKSTMRTRRSYSRGKSKNERTVFQDDSAFDRNDDYLCNIITKGNLPIGKDGLQSTIARKAQKLQGNFKISQRLQRQVNKF